jgi:hypothetical protein
MRASLNKVKRVVMEIAVGSIECVLSSGSVVQARGATSYWPRRPSASVQPASCILQELLVSADNGVRNTVRRTLSLTFLLGIRYRLT